MVWYLVKHTHNFSFTMFGSSFFRHTLQFLMANLRHGFRTVIKTDLAQLDPLKTKIALQIGLQTKYLSGTGNFRSSSLCQTLSRFADATSQQHPHFRRKIQFPHTK